MINVHILHLSNLCAMNYKTALILPPQAGNSSITWMNAVWRSSGLLKAAGMRHLYLDLTTNNLVFTKVTANIFEVKVEITLCKCLMFPDGGNPAPLRLKMHYVNLHVLTSADI